MTTVPPRVAAVLLATTTLGAYPREHAGQDTEVALVVLALTRDARDYAMSRSGISVTTTTGTNNDVLVSTTEAAHALGVTTRTVTRWINNGQLPAVPVGARYTIRLADLTQLAQQRAA